MHHFFKRLIGLLVCSLLLWLAACTSLGQFGSEGESVQPTPTLPAAAPAVAAEPPVSDGEDSPPVVVSSDITLTVWMVPEISPRSEVAGGGLLAAQLQQFDEANPNTGVFVELKAPTGPASILSYLQAGRPVAPGILPDVVLLPTDQLRTAVSAGAIFPLEAGLDSATIDDLFPVARQMGSVDGELVAYPYSLQGLSHLIVSDQQLTGTLPTSWEEWSTLQPPPTFAYPAAGQNPGLLLLGLYLAEGGGLTGDAGETALEIEPLTTALEILGQAREAGVLTSQSTSIATLEDAWQLLQSGGVATAYTTADFWVLRRTQTTIDSVAPLPGMAVGQPLVPYLQGWAWAVTTPDPARQTEAYQLINWLTSSANMGEWSLLSGSLPTRQSALDRWGEETYTAFVRNELFRAQPLPAEAAAVLPPLNNALFDLLSSPNASAAVLAAEAVDALR